jgi:hypothetical protein
MGSEGGIGAIQPDMSPDDRYVAFITNASL